jgi:hypothetical protein
MVSEEFIVICPNCKDYVIIKEINCKIFRHAILKESGEQINPHSSKEECDFFINNNLIYGCGSPFILVLKNNTYYAEKCEYI